MNAIRIVIADDERPARSFLRSTLRAFEDVEIVGEASGGIEAVGLIESLHPDLVLLDVQMPEVDGLEVAERLNDPKPIIVFIAAYAAHSARALELHALDYLLKPVSVARLRDVMDRVHKYLGRREAAR